jgi:hypothetical protein
VKPEPPMELRIDHHQLHWSGITTGKYCSAYLGPCRLVVYRWRANRHSPWLWRVDEVMGRNIVGKEFPTIDEAKDMAVQIAVHTISELCVAISSLGKVHSSHRR